MSRKRKIKYGLKFIKLDSEKYSGGPDVWGPGFKEQGVDPNTDFVVVDWFPNGGGGNLKYWAPIANSGFSFVSISGITGRWVHEIGYFAEAAYSYLKDTEHAPWLMAIILGSK